MDTFSIRVLAQRTGLTEGTLRTWGNRFGFPRGRRTDGGHRRFTAADERLVLRVLEARSAGLPLAVAVQTVLDQDRQSVHPSVFGVLGEQFPELRRVRLSRRSLTAVSHSLEEECLSRGEQPVVLGAFQARFRYEQSAFRWTELARTASWSAVVADFGGAADHTASPVQCDLPVDAPMRREWTVVLVGDSFSGTLSAWEVPTAPRQETYEVVVSTRHDVATAAARVLTGVMERYGVAAPSEVARRLAAPAPVPSPALQAADQLLARVVSTHEEHRR